MATAGDSQSDKATAGLRCPECGVKFESLEDLESHVQTDHPEVSPDTSASGKKAEASPAPKVRQAAFFSSRDMKIDISTKSVGEMQVFYTV